jgi:hypothetical protein
LELGVKTKQTETCKVSTNQKQRYVQTLRRNLYKKVKEYKDFCRQPLNDRLATISAPDDSFEIKKRRKEEMAENERVKKIYCNDFNLTTDFGNKPIP